MIVQVMAQELDCDIWDPDAPIWNTGSGLISPLRRLSFDECTLMVNDVRVESPFNKKWNPETLLQEVKSRGLFAMQIALTEEGVTLFTKEAR